MLYQLNNEGFSASISSLGAEVKSLRKLSNDQEFIWQSDADIWAGSAPVLFPIVGRLKNGQYQFEGKTYHLDKHGLARKAQFSVTSQTETRIRFSLTADQQTLQQYPFQFELSVDFSLEQNGLKVSYDIYNHDQKTMWFSLGSHPAFALDLHNNKIDDYLLKFQQAETLDRYFLEQDLLTENPQAEFLKQQQKLPLSDRLFDNDALIFKNINSRTISIDHKNNGRLLSLEIADAPHLGLWSKAGAAFVCLEPWFSYDDSHNSSGELTEKAGMMQLSPQQSFNSYYRIVI